MTSRCWSPKPPAGDNLEAASPGQELLGELVCLALGAAQPRGGIAAPPSQREGWSSPWSQPLVAGYVRFVQAAPCLAYPVTGGAPRRGKLRHERTAPANKWNSPDLGEGPHSVGVISLTWR